MAEIAAARGVRRACVLPADDPALAALAAPEREKIARLWRSRAANEMSTSSVFARLHARLLAMQVDGAVLELSERAADDERRHAEICSAVAARYALAAHDSVAPPHAADADDAGSAATFAGCSQSSETLLRVVAQCCLNETIAVGYLKTCLEQAVGPTAAVALRALLADEVAHSRIGWALLASERVGAEDRRLVARAMPQLLSGVTRVWLADPEGIHAHAPRGHGSLGEADMGLLLRATIAELVAPGLEHVGVESRSTRAWLASASSLAR